MVNLGVGSRPQMPGRSPDTCKRRDWLSETQETSSRLVKPCQIAYRLWPWFGNPIMAKTVTTHYDVAEHLRTPEGLAARPMRGWRFQSRAVHAWLFCYTDGGAPMGYSKEESNLCKPSNLRRGSTRTGAPICRRDSSTLTGKLLACLCYCQNRKKWSGNSGAQAVQKEFCGYCLKTTNIWTISRRTCHEELGSGCSDCPTMRPVDRGELAADSTFDGPRQLTQVVGRTEHAQKATR